MRCSVQIMTNICYAPTWQAIFSIAVLIYLVQTCLQVFLLTETPSQLYHSPVAATPSFTTGPDITPPELSARTAVGNVVGPYGFNVDNVNMNEVGFAYVFVTKPKNQSEQVMHR